MGLQVLQLVLNDVFERKSMFFPLRNPLSLNILALFAVKRLSLFLDFQSFFAVVAINFVFK